MVAAPPASAAALCKGWGIAGGNNTVRVAVALVTLP